MDRFMKLAFSLAKKADPFPNPRVGAVLVKNGQVIGTGYHRKAGLPHAEIEAMEDAERREGKGAVRGATLYVTLEPCSHTMKRTPPCTGKIIANGIRKVVFAMKDPNPLVNGANGLREAGVAVAGPTDGKEARGMNKRYLANIARKPFVAIKMAMSADGKTATRTGDSRWISGEKSRAYVHRMRASFDAIMVGANTVVKDDPELTTHGEGGRKSRDPYRIIVDGRLRISPDAKVLRNPDGKTIVATSGKAEKNASGKIRRIRNSGAGSGTRVFVCGGKEVDLKKLVIALGAMGMGSILIEGGSELNAKALEAGIVDSLFIFMAPKIIGGRDAKPVIGGLGIGRMADATELHGMKTKRIGGDLLLEFAIRRRKAKPKCF